MDTPDSVCRARPLLGTFVEIRSAGAMGAATEQAIDAAFEAIPKIHRLMSFHDRDSDVGRLNRDACKRRCCEILAPQRIKKCPSPTTQGQMLMFLN